MTSLSDEEKKLLDRNNGESLMDFVSRIYNELNTNDQFDSISAVYMDSCVMNFCIDLTMEIEFQCNRYKDVIDISTYIINQIHDDGYGVGFRIKTRELRVKYY